MSPRILELITDPTTGKLSSHRVARLVVCIGATFVFVRAGWSAVPPADVWMWYLGVFCGDATISKLWELRFGAKPATEPTPGA